MARSSINDPLDRFRWQVSITSGGSETFEKLGFTDVSIPEYTVTVNSYYEGGNHVYPRQIHDTIEYKPVTLQRGVTPNLDFKKWAEQYKKIVHGEEALSYRRTVILNHLNRAGETVKTYTLHDAFPIGFKPASDFAAGGDDALSIEKLVLAYESFDVALPTEDNNPLAGEIGDVTKRLTRNLF